MADETLERLRVDLKNGLTEPIIKNLVDDLQMEEVLNRDETEEILQRTKSRPNQARDLIDSVYVKGKQASETFFNSLKKHDKSLYEKLDISRLLEAGPSRHGATSSVPHETQDKGNMKREYKMENIPHGFCVIVNNENFINPKHKREGSQRDVDSLENMFTILGFQVKIHKDLTAEEIKHCMACYSKNTRLKDSDCFVCCVLSHGNEDGVLGKDEKVCPVKDIRSPFNGDNCASLIDKPKVFFIQACRGFEMQSKIVVADALSDKPDQESDLVLDKHTTARDADFLVAMSTVEGCYSLRNQNTGSWFIQSLCTHLDIGSKQERDILSILTDVNNDVSRMEGAVKIQSQIMDAKMVPQPYFTLTKTLVFRVPKVGPEKA